MKYFKKMIGDKVYLSPVNSDDYLKYVEWLNNYNIAKGVNQIRNILTIEAEKEFLSKKTDDCYNFSIINKSNDMLLGNISLMKVDFVDRTAELGIFIGEEDNLGKGYGSDAIRLILEYGFNQLNLNNIMLRVYSFNELAINAYKKCGFKIFGTLKEAHYFEGKYCDEIYMNILKRNFKK